MIICTRRIFFYGIVLMIPALFVLPVNMDWHLMVKPVNALNLLYLGLFASALCFLSWNRVVEILGAVKSSVYIYMVPVVAVVASAIILGERLTWISLTGILLTLCGVTISEYRKKRGRASEKREKSPSCKKADSPCFPESCCFSGKKNGWRTFPDGMPPALQRFPPPEHGCSFHASDSFARITGMPCACYLPFQANIHSIIPWQDVC